MPQIEYCVKRSGEGREIQHRESFIQQKCIPLKMCCKTQRFLHTVLTVAPFITARGTHQWVDDCPFWHTHTDSQTQTHRRIHTPTDGHRHRLMHTTDTHTQTHAHIPTHTSYMLCVLQVLDGCVHICINGNLRKWAQLLLSHCKWPSGHRRSKITLGRMYN